MFHQGNTHCSNADEAARWSGGTCHVLLSLLSIHLGVQLRTATNYDRYQSVFLMDIPVDKRFMHGLISHRLHLFPAWFIKRLWCVSSTWANIDECRLISQTSISYILIPLFTGVHVHTYSAHHQANFMCHSHSNACLVFTVYIRYCKMALFGLFWMIHLFSGTLKGCFEETVLSKCNCLT